MFVFTFLIGLAFFPFAMLCSDSFGLWFSELSYRRPPVVPFAVLTLLLASLPLRPYLRGYRDGWFGFLFGATVGSATIWALHQWG